IFSRFHSARRHRHLRLKTTGNRLSRSPYRSPRINCPDRSAGESTAATRQELTSDNLSLWSRQPRELTKRSLRSSRRGLLLQLDSPRFATLGRSRSLRSAISNRESLRSAWRQVGGRQSPQGPVYIRYSIAVCPAHEAEVCVRVWHATSRRAQDTRVLAGRPE